MPVIDTTAGDIAVGDIFADGSIVRARRVDDDGRMRIAHMRPRARMTRLMFLDPEVPVRVLRKPSAVRATLTA